MATTARRQASTTSLAKFVRQGSPDPNARANDFCNAFWGLGDAGVEVLFARMRGAGRTMEELRAFWKERCVARFRIRRRGIQLSPVQGGYRGRLRETIVQAV
jgi:hypothetical protein